ncbi:MAG TPA: thiol:disulfide interchange protein DsbA/DsbL [Burkholderiales bacterium]|nr:thiol:disulfide interchange protein DsbA/DsbL [Burkholderiales bacterium]
MDALRRRMLLALGVAPLAAPLAALAQAAPGGYLKLDPPVPVDTPPNKIDVIEFFWYGCPHCYRLEPLIEPWAKKLPADVVFQRIPAVFNNPQWTLDARIFYAFQALGLVQRLHRPLFDAIHRDGLRTADAAALDEWLRKHDVDTGKFDEVMKSFSVQSDTRRSMQLSLAYQITGTPALGVQGRYTINSDAVKSHEALLQTTDYLIGVVRKGVAKG